MYGHCVCVLNGRRLGHLPMGYLVSSSGSSISAAAASPFASSTLGSSRNPPPLPPPPRSAPPIVVSVLGAAVPPVSTAPLGFSTITGSARPDGGAGKPRMSL